MKTVLVVVSCFGVLFFLATVVVATVSSGRKAPVNTLEQRVDIAQDSKRGVTCYIYNGVGISCVKTEEK